MSQLDGCDISGIEQRQEDIILSDDFKIYQFDTMFWAWYNLQRALIASDSTILAWKPVYDNNCFVKYVYQVMILLK